jgi:DUF1680 family protein
MKMGTHTHTLSLTHTPNESKMAHTHTHSHTHTRARKHTHTFFPFFPHAARRNGTLRAEQRQCWKGRTCCCSKYVRVLFSYGTTADMELDLKEGDVVKVDIYYSSKRKANV